MRMQNSFEIAQTRSRAKAIKVDRYKPDPVSGSLNESAWPASSQPGAGLFSRNTAKRVLCENQPFSAIAG